MVPRRPRSLGWSLIGSLVVLAFGCSTFHERPAGDGGQAEDSAILDLSVPVDASEPEDLAPPIDLSSPLDMTTTPDTSVPLDMTMPPDMSAPLDMTTPPDLSVPLDMFVAPDMAMTPCPDGFDGTVETGCVDINECALDLDACALYQTCENSDGGYRCRNAASALAARGSITCVVLEDGAAKCWGNNAYNQLGFDWWGAPLTSPAASPIAFGVGRTVRAIVPRWGHACALFDDDSAKCWGYSWDGSLGHGDTEPRFASTPGHITFPDERTPTQLAVASRHTCAVLDDGSVRCWGLGSNNRLGYGATGDLNAPPDEPVPAVAAEHAVAVGVSTYDYSCALLRGGTVTCWGRFSGTFDVGAERIDVGHHNVCAVVADGAVKCWGLAGGNAYGQLGYGDTANRATPGVATVSLGAGRTARDVGVGSEHACALLDDGSITCWGHNNYGQLGYGDLEDRYAPGGLVSLGAGRTVTALGVGDNHTCALLDDRSVKCWGRNNDGQLGYGDTDDRSSPPPLPVNLGGASP